MPARIVLGRETQRRLTFGDPSLLLLVPRNYFRWDLRWNFPSGALELISFGARLDRFWDLRSPDIPSRGFLLVFPRWGLPWLFVCKDLNFPRWGFTVLLLSWGTTYISAHATMEDNFDSKKNSFGTTSIQCHIQWKTQQKSYMGLEEGKRLVHRTGSWELPLL